MDDDGDVVVDVEEELPDVAGALVVACVPPPAWDELFVEWISQPTAPQANTVHVDWRKPDHRRVEKRVIVKKKVVKRNQWKRGQRYSDWRRHQRVDWQRHHLRRPGNGQQWVRVGNDYLLVSVLSGVIAGIVAAN